MLSEGEVEARDANRNQENSKPQGHANMQEARLTGIGMCWKLETCRQMKRASNTKKKLDREEHVDPDLIPH